MSAGKNTFRAVILLAILAGVFGRHFFRDNAEEVAWLLPLGHTSSSREARDAITRERFPGEPSLLINQDANFYLSLFKAHPDRPWHLWEWWLHSSGSRSLSARDDPGVPLSQQTDERRRQAAEFADGVEILRELDPDNGLPLVFQAWLETLEGIPASQERHSWSSAVVVTDPRHAAKAVELLRQALGKKRFTVYGGEQGAEWARILGDPATYADVLFAMGQYAALLIPNIYVISDLGERLTAEARRRAENERLGQADDRATVKAYDILHQLQTLGARVASDNPVLFAVLIGSHLITQVTEEGVAILTGAGQTDNAGRLLARGRALLRPKLLAELMISEDRGPLRIDHELLEPSVLEDDPALIEEAKRLLATRRESMQRKDGTRPVGSEDLARAGYLAPLTFPGIDRLVPWVTPFVTLDELKMSAHFELWGWQKSLTRSLLAMVCPVFLVLLALYGVHSVVFKESVPTDYPSFRHIAAAAILFWVFSAGSGFAAALAGNFLWELLFRHWVWQVFWNIWGLFAAGWTLAFWVRRRFEKESGRKTRGHGAWLALTGLLAAVPFAYLVYSGTVGPTRANPYPLISEGFKILWPLALMFFPALVWAASALLRWMGMLWRRRRDGAALTPALRLFLAGCAGGIVLWTASYWLIDWQEKEWGSRDTLIVPRPPAFDNSPISSRIVDIYRRHLEEVLAAPDRD